MNTITIENAICFLVGLAVVYLMFRAMGVFLLIGISLLVQSVNAHTLEIDCLSSYWTTNSGSEFQDDTQNSPLYFPLGVTKVELTDYWVNEIGNNFMQIDNQHDWQLVLYDDPYETADNSFRVNQILSPDYWPAVSAGIAFGLACCGFGWKLRMVKRTSSDF